MTQSRVVSADNVVEVIRDTATPYATTTDIAEGLDVTAQTIRNNAAMLEQDDRIRKGKVGQSSVYWVGDAPEATVPPKEEGSSGREGDRDHGDEPEGESGSKAAEEEARARTDGGRLQFERKHDTLTVVESMLLGVVLLSGSATLLAVVGGVIDQYFYNWFPYNLLAADGFVVAGWVAGTMMLVATVALLVVVANVADTLQYHVEERLGVGV